MFWVLSGDLDFMLKRFKFADFGKNAEPCTCCQANGTDKPWTDIRDGVAVWMQHIWTATAYNTAHPDRHIFLKLVPGVSVLSYVPDIMHCKILGSDPVFLGNIIRYLTHYVLGGNPDQNLRLVWAEIKAFYRELCVDNRYSNLTHNMVHPPNKKLPQLKGKTADVRDIIRPLWLVANKYLSMDAAHHRDMVDGLEATMGIEQIIHEHKHHAKFPAGVAAEFRRLCFRFGQCQDSLIRHFHPDTPLFNVTVKTHYVLHLGLIAAYLNPHLGACWSGEDLMQIVRRLLVSCAPGCTPVQSQLKAIRKYALAMSFEYSLAKRGKALL